MSSDSVLIVGGGVSGLAAAYFLAQLGIRSVIVEKSRLGGLIKTDQIEGCELEAGPDSYISTKPAVTELAGEIPGLAQKIIGSNDEARRIFIVRKGCLMAMPAGMVMMVPGAWGPLLGSKLLSLGAKLRVLRETMTAPRERTEDFSVGELVQEHFGSEMLDYVTEPLLCGVYGGDAARLSANSVLPRFVGFERRYGSLIKGVRHTSAPDQPRPQKPGSLFRSFRGGMQTLTDALFKAAAGSVTVVSAEATRVEKTESGWRVRFGAESISCRDVVLACPAHVKAKLLEAGAPGLASELAAVPYSSAILAMLVFDRATLGHPLNGFGFLVPRSERKTVAAATWVNTKFPSRVPPGLAALRAFVVGEDAAKLLQAPKETIIELARAEFRRLMGITCEPLFTTVHVWPDSMPQYTVGHAGRVRKIFEIAQEYPGIHLAGNAYDGVGVPDCIRRAKDISKQIGERRI